MERKIITPAFLFSALGAVCIVIMVAIKLSYSFYFGEEKEALKLPSLEIRNERGYINTLPKWFYAGKDGYKLVFGVNTPEPGESYATEENPSTDRAPMVLAVLNPFEKEMYQVQDNIYRENLDDGRSAVSLSQGQRYATLQAGNGVLTYEEGEQYINYSVYYTFKNRTEAILPQYGNPNLAYVGRRALLQKPVININSLGGGGFFGTGFMQGQPGRHKVIPLPVGKIIDWIGDSELLISSSRLNTKFQYVDMHDLWRMSIDGGQPQMLCDNVYSPLMYANDQTVIFLRREGKNSYSLWQLTLNGEGSKKKVTEFNYTSSKGELPAMAITAWRQMQGFDICYTVDSENGKKSIMAANSQNGHTRLIVKDQAIIGPIISSSNIDLGEGKYLLYFSEENEGTKAYVTDNEGNVKSEIFELLKAAPVEAYVKQEAEQQE